MTKASTPHGGKLIYRFKTGQEADVARQEAKALPVIPITEWTRSDLEMIGVGAFSPLTGFMGEKDYQSVLTSMHLQNGLVWTLPVVLPVEEALAHQLIVGTKAALKGEDGTIYGTIAIREVYAYDKAKEAQAVYRTTDLEHPGVARLFSQPDFYVAGEIVLLEKRQHDEFPELYKEPAELREIFAQKGWKSIVGFQTRNPIHRAHEYIQKTALETVDALLLHPLVGATKSDDVPASVRVQSYKVLLENYYPKDRVLLSAYPAAMRYAGPREAVLHAIVRKNYGCTHFIVGRDHAGVGDYYGSYDAQKIFSTFEEHELGISPLFFENSFYCNKCDGMASEKTCPHDVSERIILSGTKVRAILRQGEKPSSKFSRPEVAQVLVEGMAGVTQ